MGDYFDSASRPYDAGVAAERSRVLAILESEETKLAARNHAVAVAAWYRGRDIDEPERERMAADAVAETLRSRLGLEG